jgi:hypothetical protein
MKGGNTVKMFQKVNRKTAKFRHNLARVIEENPGQAVVVFSGLIAGTAKLLDSSAKHRNARTDAKAQKVHAREIRRRELKDRADYGRRHRY